ncbi:extracellular solute-binding protein [Cohnella silvisoli]|uniref:Extracellular solute-binding protein n=1 Tax=Cohnella silvisoli TaxID=2873699 RepID=A0ABV1KYX7_9BACL|nr:extracellular solute-binding protein [Cohnella silvisoli]MCD9024101.1 extracellular solute-binding protein [Cohnella silvisoli]
MNRKRMASWALVGTLVLSAVLSACTDNKNSSNTSSPSPSSSSTSSPAPSSSASAPAMADGPLGKYDPPITVTTVRMFNSGLEFVKGQDWDNNVYTNGLKDELGIIVKNQWIVDDQQYTNKLNVSMVSGDLPDVFEVTLQQLQLLVEAGALADLTDAYNKYSSDLTKKSFGEGDGIALKAVTFNGKLMAIPNGGTTGREDSQFIWIRKDWLKKLNLQPPATMDDVVNIAKAFATGDPDGNNKKDTFGLNLDYNLFNGWAGLDGFFNGYHAYPYNPGGPTATGLNLMFLNKGGQLDYADIQPEVKTALGKLQELYKAGAINPEFSVMSGEKSAELATAGKVGMTFGQFWNAGWPLNEMKSKDPKVDWGVFPLVSADDQPVLKTSNSITPTRFWVVSKNAKNPEAAIKFLNFYLEKNYGETRDENYHSVKQDGKDIATFGLSPVLGGFSETNQNDFYAVQDAFKSNDPSKLNPTAKGYYDGIVNYRKGDLKAWPNELMFGTEDGSAYGILGTYKKNNEFMTNAYLGAPTATMAKNGPALKDLEVKEFTKIIMGEQPLDTFDTFVDNWKKQGGQQILNEVNEWLKQHQ